MKRFITFSLILVVFSFLGRAQELSQIDFISPFYDGLAAVQKGDSWGFINEDGKLVVEFRYDLVLKEVNGHSYPVFNSGRCLIHEKREGISYFGYIDDKGKTVLPLDFLNATHFKEGTALVLKLFKNVLGRNDVLGKAMIDYSYREIIIDVNGQELYYIFEDPVHITLSKDFIKEVPEIKSKFLAKSILAVKMEEKKWSIKKL